MFDDRASNLTFMIWIHHQQARMYSATAAYVSYKVSALHLPVIVHIKLAIFQITLHLLGSW